MFSDEDHTDYLEDRQRGHSGRWCSRHKQNLNFGLFVNMMGLITFLWPIPGRIYFVVDVVNTAINVTIGRHDDALQYLMQHCCRTRDAAKCQQLSQHVWRRLPDVLGTGLPNNGIVAFTSHILAEREQSPQGLDVCFRWVTPTKLGTFLTTSSVD